MSVSDDLNATADEIERRGWIQGDYLDTDTGKVCIVGGIEHALGIYQNQMEHHDPAEIGRRIDRSIAVRGAIKEYIGLDRSIEGWNDDEAESQEEVIQMLRDAAIKNQPDSMWG